MNPAPYPLAMHARIVLLLAACATTGSVGSAPESAGRLLRFLQPCTTLVDLVPSTLPQLGFVIRSSEPAEPCGLTVVAVKPLSFASGGEIVRITIEPGASGGTHVPVHARRVTNPTAIGDWSKRKALLADLQERA